MKKQILTTIIILLCLGRAFGQPQIFLGSSRAAIKNYMNYEIRWMLKTDNADRLVYSNPHEKVSIAYHFVKNSPGIGRTCIMCSITLPDTEATEKYIRHRVTGLRYKPSTDNLQWTLMTDLSDFTIHVIRCGNTLIYKY
mgnify:FL=1